MDFAGMLAHERQRKAKEKAIASTKSAADQLRDTKLPKLTRLEEKAGAPSTIWYCDQFFGSSEEAGALESAIRSNHKPSEWLRLPKRRLLNLGGVPHPDGMIAEELPTWLRAPVLDRLEALGIFPQGIAPNQILLNEYEPGMGIDPHADGPLYVPCVAIISLGSAAILHFLRPSSQNGTGIWQTPPVANVHLSPGSILVFSDDAYEQLLHGILDVSEDVVTELTINRTLVGSRGIDVGTTVSRGHRLSLTIRAVRKVSVQPNEFLQQQQREEAQRRRDWWARAVSEKQTQKAGLRQFDVNNVPRPLGGLATQIAQKTSNIERRLRKVSTPSSENQNGYHVDPDAFHTHDHKKEACVDTKCLTEEAWAWPE